MVIDRKKHIKFLDALSDAVVSIEGQSLEDIKEDLRHKGIEVEAVLDRLKNARLNISMASKRAALEDAREKRLNIVEKGHKFIGKFSGWTKDQIIERIKGLSGGEVGFAYRDLEAMGTEEIASILEDLEMAHQGAIEENNDSE
jgi:hypothetical protein